MFYQIGITALSRKVHFLVTVPAGFPRKQEDALYKTSKSKKFPPIASPQWFAASYVPATSVCPVSSASLTLDLLFRDRKMTFA